jgi:uncharacterized protein YkwD
MESIAGRVRYGRLAFVVLLVAFGLAFTATKAQAAQTSGAYESCLLDEINSAREAAGSAPVQMASDLVPAVRDYSEWMRNNTFQHMSDSRRQEILPSTWWTWGENIAMWGDPDAGCSSVHNMFMNSSGHRANILNPDFEWAALGAYIDSSGTWVTQLFFSATSYSPESNGRFWDDDDSVFEGAIETLAAAGITDGCNPPDNDRFCPEDYVTRGEMAAFLVRGLGLTGTAGIDFTDDDGSVFESAIEKLAAAGITEGCNPPANTRFCPDQYVTRETMAAFLVRGLGLTQGGGTDFVDDDGSMFESAIEKLAAAGVTQGCNPPTNNRFCPGDRVTREMMAAFLVRGLGL